MTDDQIDLDIQGQISLEFILIIVISMITSLAFAQAGFKAVELNTCMAAARNGATEGCAMDNMAVYPSEKFKQYTENHPRLKTCSIIKIVSINWLDCGFDTKYHKNKLMIQIIASTPSNMDKWDRACEGDRINYYARKNICKAFKTENLTNIYYNPAFSDNYYITTYDVKWV